MYFYCFSISAALLLFSIITEILCYSSLTLKNASLFCNLTFYALSLTMNLFCCFIAKNFCLFWCSCSWWSWYHFLFISILSTFTSFILSTRFFLLWASMSRLWARLSSCLSLMILAYINNLFCSASFYCCMALFISFYYWLEKVLKPQFNILLFYLVLWPVITWDDVRALPVVFINLAADSLLLCDWFSS